MNWKAQTRRDESTKYNKPQSILHTSALCELTLLFVSVECNESTHNNGIELLGVV